MKKIYFVRHGQSVGNVGPIRQTADTPLTDDGRAQAEFIAERCSKLQIDAIISSTMIRAQETTEFISKKISKPVEFSDLFVERRRPSIMLGRPKDDPEALTAEKIIQENFHKSGFRFSDEENFDDLKARANAALNFLRNHSADNILVVTHGLFLRTVLAALVFGEEMTGEECEKVIQTFVTKNTGLTVIFTDEKTDKWKLLTWNDYAHLG